MFACRATETLRLKGNLSSQGCLFPLPALLPPPTSHQNLSISSDWKILENLRQELESSWCMLSSYAAYLWEDLFLLRCLKHHMERWNRKHPGFEEEHTPESALLEVVRKILKINLAVNCTVFDTVQEAVPTKIPRKKSHQESKD